MIRQINRVEPKSGRFFERRKALYRGLTPWAVRRFAEAASTVASKSEAKPQPTDNLNGMRLPFVLKPAIDQSILHIVGEKKPNRRPRITHSVRVEGVHDWKRTVDLSSIPEAKGRHVTAVTLNSVRVYEPEVGGGHKLVAEYDIEKGRVLKRKADSV